MTTTLIILSCVAVGIAIIVLIYALFAYRKMGIVMKKTDYLIENLTYSVETLTPAIESLAKLSNYSELLEKILHNNAEIIAKYASKSNKDTKQLTDKIKSINIKKTDKKEDKK